MVAALKIGSDCSSACPDAIQIKRSLYCLNRVDRIMVMLYAFYTLGFWFESHLHLADFVLVFFVRLSFCFFSLLFFRLTFYVYKLVLG